MGIIFLVDNLICHDSLREHETETNSVRRAAYTCEIRVNLGIAGQA